MKAASSEPVEPVETELRTETQDASTGKTDQISNKVKSLMATINQ